MVWEYMANKKKNKKCKLDEDTLSYLINLLNKSTKISPTGSLISSGIYELDGILDTLVDGLYIDNISAIEFFKKHKLSRTLLKSKVRKQIPDLLSQTKIKGNLGKYLIEPLKKEAKKKRSQKSYYFVFPQNVDLKEAINKQDSIRYKKYLFHLYDYFSFRRTKFSNDEVIKLLEKRCCKNSLMKTGFTFFVTKLKGPDPHYLASHVEEIFTEILALLNLTRKIRRNSKTWGNKLYAISPIKFPPIYFTYDNRKKYINYRYGDNTPFEKFLAFTLEQYNYFIQNKELICELPKKGALNELIFENLRLYQEGIEEIKQSESCFKFWNAIESVTQINNKGHVPMRANSILKKPSPKWRLKLEVLREKRHKYAHKSISYFVASDQLFLKRVSEELFIFLINHSKTMKSLSDLELLYLISSRNPQKLKDKLTITKRELELTKYVLNERGKRGPRWLSRIV